MLSLFWVFTGFLTGLLVAVVFIPPMRKVPKVPTPTEKNVLETGAGCMKFTAKEVPCDKDAGSLNFIAAQHK